MIVGAHAEAIKSVVCSQKHGVVVTGSWDKTIKVWRVADLQCIGEYPQPDKVYTMSLAGDRVVVGMVRWSRCRCCFSCCFSCCCCAQEQHSMERERERQTKPTYACTCSSCSFDAVLQAGRHVWVWNLNDMVCHCAHMKEGRRRTRRIRRTRRKERERERERERCPRCELKPHTFLSPSTSAHLLNSFCRARLTKDESLTSSTRHAAFAPCQMLKVGACVLIL